MGEVFSLLFTLARLERQKSVDIRLSFTKSQNGAELAPCALKNGTSTSLKIATFEILSRPYVITPSSPY